MIQNDSKTDSHVAYTLVNSNNSWSIDDSNADQKQEEKDGSDDIAPRVRGTSLFLYVTAILLLSILVLLCLIDNSVYALIRHFLARQRRLEKERAAKATITTTAASTASSPTEAEDSYQRGWHVPARMAVRNIVHYHQSLISDNLTIAACLVLFHSMNWNPIIKRVISIHAIYANIFTLLLPIPVILLPITT